MFLATSLILIVNLIATINCKTLPSYIEICSRSESNFNKCIKEHAIASLPNIIKGDKEYKLPPLSPYRISKVDIDAGGNLKIGFTDAILTGLDTTIIVDASMDLEKKILSFKTFTTKAAIIGDYKIDGRILVLPITGNGKGNITLEDINGEYTLNYDLVKEDDGKEVFKITKTTLVIDPKVTHYSLENLFNGDKTLGAEMDKFLNENHKEIGKDLNPGFAKVVEAIVNNIIDTFIKDAVFDDIFKP